MSKRKEIVINKVKYTKIKTIGNGGSGDVWKAESNGKIYAIKIINSNSNSKKERFKKEIEFCLSDNHKNIIKIIDKGEINESICYVMPLYPKTLRDVIDKEKNSTKLIDYILQLCNALKYIHSNDIFHRDIKPENILIQGNNLVLADFGIAHFKDSKLTKKGDLLANRNYAAPEQKKKHNANNIDSAADIFSLGLLINECFTKNPPFGSDFQLIAAKTPLYAELDNLVFSMIRQNPSERVEIDTVIAELKFIHGKIENALKQIRINIDNQIQSYDFEKPILKEIIQRASEDILFGKLLFNSKSSEELDKYNGNWHMKIGYCVDDFLFNLLMQERILLKCKAKFEYESNVYRKDNWYKTLDLTENKNHKLLYDKLNNILSKYKFQNKRDVLDLTGKILKYYSSCTDYHCEEILESIKQEEDLAVDNLKNKPILWNVKYLKSNISHKTLDLLEKSGFIFENHITISPERIGTYHGNYDDLNLLDRNYKRENKQIQEILSEFENKWSLTITKINEDEFSIKFTTYEEFEKF